MEELTVRENVEYPARLAKRLPELAGRVDELLGALGLVDLADRLPVETSIGEQQRTALARALVLSPRLLLADEPTGHQDAGWSERVLVALRDAAAGGTSCLVATHNPPRPVLRHGAHDEQRPPRRERLERQEPGSMRLGAPYWTSTSGTVTAPPSSWKFSRIAIIARAVTAVPLSVCTCSGHALAAVADVEAP